MAKLQQCYESLNIPRSHMDLEQSLMMLEVYKFLERPAKLPKGMAPLKTAKSGSKGAGLIESKFSKEELKQYLQEIPAFSLFFASQPPN